VSETWRWTEQDKASLESTLRLFREGTPTHNAFLKLRAAIAEIERLRTNLANAQRERDTYAAAGGALMGANKEIERLKQRCADSDAVNARYVKRVAELERDADRLDFLEMNDLQVLYRAPGWHLKAPRSSCEYGQGPTIREAINNAIDAVRSGETDEKLLALLDESE